MKHLILGTAGHIDHGKTSLVKALTGIDTDRLKEEKARGITIELGFAHLELPGGIRFGIVDVPGHERFVRAMVAGVGGMDLVMLVIAADEGVMPQTREHLDILRLLGVKSGLVALTKRDLVEREWLELVTEEVRDFVAGSFLEGAPIVPVSSRSGEGLDELRAELARLADCADEKRREGQFPPAGGPGLHHGRLRDGGDRHAAVGRDPCRRRAGTAPLGARRTRAGHPGPRRESRNRGRPGSVWPSISRGSTWTRPSVAMWWCRGASSGPPGPWMCAWTTWPRRPAS